MTGHANKTKVSVCLLTYNRAHLLPRSIESILNQDFCDFELIISDDCSSDNTTDVCEEYIKHDSRVKYFRNERNLRYAGNQNAAMKRAGGEYIAYVHDGDIYYPQMLKEWVSALDKYPSAGIVFNAVDVRAEYGVAAATHVHEYQPLVSGEALFEEMMAGSSSPIFGIIMLRASALRALGQFDTSLPVLADVDMWLRLLLRYDAAYVGIPLYEVMPREVGHINRPRIVNWAIQAERDRIYVVNLARRHGGWNRVPVTERRGLLRRRLIENGRSLLRCALGGDLERLGEGARAILAGRPWGTTLNLRASLDKVAQQFAVPEV